MRFFDLHVLCVIVVGFDLMPIRSAADGVDMFARRAGISWWD